MSHSMFRRCIHTGQETVFGGVKGVETVSLESEDDDDAVMNDFLSRFVWIMRGKLNEVYTNADKKEIDAMLHIIVGKVVAEMEEDRLEHFIDSEAASVSQDFSDDLWTTVKEVSSVVLEDMKKAKKKEKMKTFLQCEEVKEMTRFAGEIGIRGDMLRELRFKWAREKLEDSDFYESLERMRKDAMEPEVEAQSHEASESKTEGEYNDDDGDQVISLPKRSGKIKYNIYGLDLSKPKWAEVAEQIHEAGESVWPEPKQISGKCKIVTEKIVSLKADDDPSPLIAEWVELLQPSRVDWVALLDRLKEQNDQIYFKVAEHVLDEESYQPNVTDYSQLVQAHANHNKISEAERIIKKMDEKGIIPDILTKTTMVHMYSKAGNLKLAIEAFNNLKSQGFRPDAKVYKSMIMAYANAGDPVTGESFMREMDLKNIKRSQDLFLALIRSFALKSDPIGADRVSTYMGLAGYQPSLESNTYLIEAYSRRGNADDARKHFDEIIKLGYKPDDKCIALVTAAYAEKNLLDKGLELLLQLEKDGIEHGLATYSVLIDWLGKLQLIDEAEDLLEKFTEKGVSPSLDVHISLCDMYARAGEQKKTLQALGVLEANKDKLGHPEFERVIDALLYGGFKQDAERMYNTMTAMGFTASTHLDVTLKASQTFSRTRSFTK
ncbi:hypothetical protein QVD17_01185 [Tagetes erecta]|uniref:Pentatricopeptide repeat-containing protein n=1 Tax=Tagetes erecta TaxID=13708 RepID=A0AAD8P7W6_TARER|nr:hypothetical protein QVD17_01185 [Tagetes erecta]